MRCGRPATRYFKWFLKLNLHFIVEPSLSRYLFKSCWALRETTGELFFRATFKGLIRDVPEPDDVLRAQIPVVFYFLNYNNTTSKTYPREKYSLPRSN